MCFRHSHCFREALRLFASAQRAQVLPPAVMRLQRASFKGVALADFTLLKTLLKPAHALH